MGAVACGGVAFAPATLAQAPRAPRRSDDFGGGGGEVPWVPTPDDMLDIMLRLARVGPGDLVCDLGSGDGRIPIHAARRYGARSLGVEIDPVMVANAWRNAQRAGVAERVRFIEGDLFETDFSAATVITLYLLTHMNDRLRPKLLSLRPGTRIVAHNFGMNDWDADQVAFHNETRALLWYVPARVDGVWRMGFEASSERLTMTVIQSYQKISGEVFFGNNPRTLRNPEVRGDRVRFAVEDPNGRVWSFHGRADGAVMRGFATDGVAQRRFSAQRAT